ncbi:MAG: hypothetical protein ACC628_07520 [Pirellulaceae bacterium]
MCKLIRLTLVITLCGPFVGASAWGAEQLDLRLRVTWGGGAHRLWQGVIYVRGGGGGRCGQPHTLGVEADAPTIVNVDAGRLRFWQHTPTAFDGLELHVLAARDASLIVEMVADRQSEQFEIPLSRFADERGFRFRSDLDAQRNRLLARRAPGDHLRVEFDRDALVFAPGESFSFQLTPHLLGLPAGTALKCALRLSRTGDDDELWSRDQDLRTTEQGHAEVLGPFHVELPAQEGVYEFLFSLSQRRFTDRIVGSKYIMHPKPPEFQRKLQLVVVDPNPRPAERSEWREVAVIDLTSREWWERWMVPQLSLLPGLDRMTQGPLGNGELKDLGNHLTQIDGGKWHALPIPISRVGQPHILELEYANHLRQTIGISIVEANAAGEVTSLGVDSGVDVVGRPSPAEPGLEKHRLVFWPRTKTPWLVLTNRRDESAAVVGRVRVLAGPKSLPAAATTPERGDARLLAVYYDKPFFPENFSATEALDKASNRSLDDWRTFHQGGQRLCEYLKYVGYNAAVISAVRDGGSLYPSPLLATTPKYDNGLFFVTGQDPVQKDVLEMLFRLFDREGLKLIPAVRFAFPLPELEALLRVDGRNAEGVELIGERGLTGEPMRGRDLARRGSAPYYNPLDARVQTAMRRVLHEMAERYAHHRSFAGICLQMGPETYIQLPDEAWPYDRATVGRFQAETNTRIAGDGVPSFADRSRFLHDTGQQAWLEWRSRGLAAFYREIQRDLANVREDTKLYLAMAQLLAGRPAQQGLRPRLLAQSDISQVLLRHGIDAARFRDDPSVILMRPQRLAPRISLASQAVNIALSRSPRVDACFRGSTYSGVLNYHEPLTLRLEGFDEKSPFGSDRTQLRMAAHIPPSGARNRARFVHYLSAMDAQFLADGGWMVPLGQEDALRPIFEVFRQLPDAPFKTWQPQSPSGRGADVAVRSLSRGGRSYVYVVNDSPWTTVVHLELQVSAQCAVQSLSTRPLPQLIKKGEGSSWTLELEPYDLVGAVLQTPDLSIDDWRVTYRKDVVGELSRLIKEVRVRVNELSQPEPYKVLENPDFELPLQENVIRGWFYSQREGVTIRAEAVESKQGRQCLHMRVDKPNTIAWVRSKPFKPPKTGRIYVLAWVRTRDSNTQPPLRLSIDGSDQYYRFAPLGYDVNAAGKPTGQPAQPLPEKWPASPYLLPIDDLPTGLDKLLIGFDMMGEGEVWIDDVQVFDLYFQRNEQDELLKRVGIADFHLGKGRVSDCTRYLNGYWPQLLLEHVTPPTARVAALPDNPRERRAPPAERDATSEEPSSGWWRYIPHIPHKLPFQRND